MGDLYKSCFHRSFRVEIILLVLLLPLMIIAERKPGSFYDGDDTEGFLSLCINCNDCSEVDKCDQLCKNAVRLNSNERYNETSNPCDPKHFQALRKGQDTVNKFRHKLNSYFESIVLWVLFLPCVFLGIYLISVGHFDWRTLPVIGSKYHPNETHGIAYWQYHRMKYVINKSEMKKRDSTYMYDVRRPNSSFVYDERSYSGDSDASEYSDDEGVVE